MLSLREWIVRGELLSKGGNPVNDAKITPGYGFNSYRSRFSNILSIKMVIFSHPKVLTQYVWVLKRTVSMRRFFLVPTTYALVEK